MHDYAPCSAVGPVLQEVERVDEDRVWLRRFSDPLVDVTGWARIIGDSPSDPVPHIVPGAKVRVRVRCMVE